MPFTLVRIIDGERERILFPKCADQSIELGTRVNQRVFLLNALGAVECERIFQDTASGAEAARPGLVACLDHLRRNDVLVVLDLDRLGR